MVEVKYCIYCGKNIQITKMHDKYSCKICNVKVMVLSELDDILEKHLKPLRDD